MIPFAVGIIVIGLFVSKTTYSKMPEWIEKPPVILLYSTDKNAHVPVNCYMTDAGKMEIRVVAESLFLKESETVYLCIFDQSFPFEWVCDENYTPIELTEAVYGESIAAKDISKRSGQETELWLRLTPRNDKGVYKVTISFDDDHLSFRDNGVFIPRLPWVCTDTPKELMDDHSAMAKEQYAILLNGNRIYSPMLSIHYHFAAHSSLFESGLQYDRSLPEPSRDSYSPMWDETDAIYPSVQYTDNAWEHKRENRELLGGIMIGLGTSIMTIPLAWFAETEWRNRFRNSSSNQQ